MSDFDKEAERERLREQYEAEQRKREATEHMSELLLKGATMTDAHCEECGDPIFRYDGQEFCPTCQESVSAGEAEGEGSDEPQATEATDAADTAPSDAQQGETDTPQERTPADTSNDRTQPADQDEGTTRGSQAEPAEHAPDRSTSGSDRIEVPTAAPTTDRTDRRASGQDGTLADARESLEATLVRFARQAEATDNPRRASEALEAAREAADALAALDDLR
jgi:uncharacterized Zn finger protein (UPF0148 family)